ncbi:MAG TPA: serine/threonine-protein kinase [Blastocatellia bacterium]|nr:serine/threonine-protein kinase [Blastocatellia bacterium]
MTKAVSVESISSIKTFKEIPQNQPEDLFIGRTIDRRYFLESKLGGGGMGAVYRAKRLLIGDMAAVKILNPEHSADSRAVERFYREAKVCASLRHPNAVMVYDFGVTEDKLIYFVMELIEGKDLRRIIMQTGRLPYTEAANILIQVCAVLNEAHNKNVVHRDLKPENILVSSTPTGRRVKVLDFGIAALRNFTDDKLTQTGSIVGTPHYMSPEQCMGEELDGRSDIYSLGIILYEMLAGTVPFDSKTPTAIAVQQVNKVPPPLRELNPNVPPQVEAVVMRALKKRPEERPQTAAALAEELIAAVHNHPISSAGQNAEVEQSIEKPKLKETRATRRGGALGLLAASMILLLTVAAGSSPWRYFKNDGSRQQTTTPVVANPVVTNIDQAPTPDPQVKTDQLTTPATTPAPPIEQTTTNIETKPSPLATGEKTTSNIETKPALPSGEQPVRKSAVETRKRIATTRKVAPQKAVIPGKDADDDRGADRFDRDRRMRFDDYDRYRYRRYGYNSYGPGYRDGYYMRRRPRWYYRER